jgi:ABC-type transporter Mla subunit MlaD
VDGAARHLLRTARLLDEAAEAVDGHALAVERSLDELAALASRVLGSVTGGP